MEEKFHTITSPPAGNGRHMGARRSWRVGAGCKPVALLRRFESFSAHHEQPQGRPRMPQSGCSVLGPMEEIGRPRLPVTEKIAGSNPVRTASEYR